MRRNWSIYSFTWNRSIFSDTFFPTQFLALTQICNYHISTKQPYYSTHCNTAKYGHGELNIRRPDITDILRYT